MKSDHSKTPSIPFVRKLICCLPFLLVLGLLTNTWHDFLTDQFIPSAVHYVTLVLFLVNGVLLLIRFKPGLLLTGLLLLISGFGLLFYFTDTSSFLTMFGITIPFEGWSFLIFLGYFAINIDLLIKWQLEAKHKKYERGKDNGLVK
jgi:hypothetical protein